MSSHAEGAVRVEFTGEPYATAKKIAQFMNANGFTAAQYAAGKAACVKRAKGESLTAQETTLADRFEAMAAAIVGDLFDVTLPP